MELRVTLPALPSYQWHVEFPSSGFTISYLDADANSFTGVTTYLDADANSFDIQQTYLDADGNSFTVA